LQSLAQRLGKLFFCCKRLTSGWARLCELTKGCSVTGGDFVSTMSFPEQLAMILH
jgi:hypothetical protein